MEIQAMNSGTELLAVLNQVRDFFEQAAGLLATTDAMMQKADWKPLKGTMATSDLSYALHGPRQWMPHYLCRSYEHTDKPTLLASVSIVLGMFERDPNELKKLTEPLVCGSSFTYEDGKRKEGWLYEFSTWHLYMPNRRDDGSVCGVDPRVEWPGEKCTASLMQSFA